MQLTQDIVRELLDYNPDTGVFTWNFRGPHHFKTIGYFNHWNNMHAGSVAGCIYTDSCGKKYIRIGINGKGYAAHRIAWLYVHKDTADEIDHIDGNGVNNKISNLRSVSRQENQRNKRMGKRNTSGVVGVSWNKSAGMWSAQITISRVRKHLGCFRSFNAAVAARKSAEIEYDFHKNHGSDRPL